MQVRDVEPVLFISNKLSNPNAGTESQLLNLINHLPRDRFKPKLLVLQRSAFTDSGALSCDVDALGYSSLQDPRTWLAFWRYARRAYSEGYRLAHIFFHDPSIIAPPLLHAAGIRSIISRRDMGYWYNKWYLFVLRITGRFASKVVVNSRAVGEIAVSEEHIRGDKVELIYNGYDLPENAQQSLVQDIREIKDNGLGPIIFLVANFRPLKRIEDAIQALSLLSKESVDAQLVVIGSGDWLPLESLAEGLGISDRVHFLGGRKDVKAYLPFGDIGILCSESEGYSNSVVEYMQAGLPAVVSDVGGNREAVIHGETGFRYPVKNVDQLSKHLLFLLNHPEIAREMGSSGKVLAVERHNLQKMIGAHVELYDMVLGNTDCSHISGEY